MPALANIAISDGTATRTFTPDTVDRATNAAHFLNRASGIPVGYDKLSCVKTNAAKNGKVDKVNLTLMVPTLAQSAPSTASGIQPNPQAAYFHQVNVQFFLPTTGTEAERTVLLNLLKNALASSHIDTMVKKVEGNW